MAPNKRGGPPTSSSVLTAAEVAARGSGSDEDIDTYDPSAKLKSEARVLCTGVMFLTRLPLSSKPSSFLFADHHAAFLMRSAMWFPLIGALVGAWASVFWNAMVVLWPAAVAAGASTLASIWLTGCFHEDGLADCFDGFGGGWGRVQILRIMKDSRCGTYAVVGMALVLHMKLHALAAFPVDQVGAVLVAAHCASRWTSLPMLYFCHYVQDPEDAKAGLYNWFAESQRLLTPPRLLVGTATAVLVPWLAVGWQGMLVACATAVFVAAAASIYGQSIIGGVMGDFLGATIQVTELCIYLALLADWSVLSTEGPAAWGPCAVLAVTALLPVVYTRRIVDFGPAAC